MIPSADEVLDGFPFVARRIGVSDRASPAAVSAAVAYARTLAATEHDEAAAMFYAFACHPRAFPGAWRVMTRVLAGAQAHKLGLRIDASVSELDDLCVRLVLASRPSFDDVRRWFAARLVAIR